MPREPARVRLDTANGGYIDVVPVERTCLFDCGEGCHLLSQALDTLKSFAVNQ